MNTTPHTPPPPPPGSGPADGPSHSADGSGPQRSREELRDLGRIRRTVGGQRTVAGVAGGLARHLDIDPVILRVAFVVLTFFGGAGLLVYGACWLLVPEDGEERAIVHVDERSRLFALAGVGLLAAFAVVGDSWGLIGFPWPVAIAGLFIAIAVVNYQKRRSGDDRPAAFFGPPSTGQWGPPPGAVPLTKDADAVVGSPTGAPVGSSYDDRASAPLPPLPPQQWQFPSRPRKRGPILFGWTLALMALAIGMLSTLDVAGVDVADSAYPATALGVAGVMLLVGAFFGRAGGVILLGLVAAVATAGTVGAESWDADPVTHRPLSAAEVNGDYRIGAGELTVDLTQVRDPSELDGRTIEVRADMGRVVVLLPEALDVDWEARIDGAGNVITPDDGESGGVDVKRSGTEDVAGDVGTLHLTARVDLGEIEFRTAA